MRFGLWSIKGGSGCTTATLGVARHLADKAGSNGVLVVDLDGDCAAAAGIAESPQGVTDWLNDDNAPLEALNRLESETTDRKLSLLQTGGASRWSPTRNDLVSQLIALEARDVVIDCGQIADSDESSLGGLKRTLLSEADRSLLCTRACYLALRGISASTLEASGVVVLREAGRSYNDFDIEDSVGAPVVASVDSVPAVSRSIDAGRLLERPPRGFLRQLRGAAQ